MSVAEEIQRLTLLRDQGELTKAEFEAAKTRAIHQTPVGFEVPNPSSNQTAMLLHFSQYLGFLFPLLGFAAPILIWQLKKDTIPELDIHGRIIANWMLSSLIYSIVSIALVFVFIGFIGLLLIGLLSVIYPMVGGIKANDGTPWDYPGSIRFF